MICNNCGTEIEPNARFCTCCGTVVSATSMQENASVYTDSAHQVYNNTVNANPTNTNSYNANSVNANPYNANPVNPNPYNANPAYNGGMMNSNPMNAASADPLDNILEKKEGPAAAYGYATLKKKEFINLPVFAKLKKGITGTVIGMYVICGINVALMCIGMGSIVDLLIMLGLSVAIHLLYSFGASIAYLVYGIINLIYMLIALHTPGGWYIIICGICAVIYTSKISKYYKEYQRTGYIPEYPVA
ncbi:MAG: hypothetical protein J5802_05970 [Butyrivibrio sp.]|nr:hypothetical protein [Butyrivibrio sp.]